MNCSPTFLCWKTGRHVFYTCLPENKKSSSFAPPSPHHRIRLVNPPHKRYPFWFNKSFTLSVSPPLLHKNVCATQPWKQKQPNFPPRPPSPSRSNPDSFVSHPAGKGISERSYLSSFHVVLWSNMQRLLLLCKDKRTGQKNVAPLVRSWTLAPLALGYFFAPLWSSSLSLSQWGCPLCFFLLSCLAPIPRRKFPLLLFLRCTRARAQTNQHKKPVFAFFFVHFQYPSHDAQNDRPSDGANQEISVPHHRLWRIFTSVEINSVAWSILYIYGVYWTSLTSTEFLLRLQSLSNVWSFNVENSKFPSTNTTWSRRNTGRGLEWMMKMM